MLLKTLRISFSRFYDSLGTCMGVNLLWFSLSLFSAGLLLPPATAGLYHHHDLLLRFEHPGIRDFFAGFRRFFWKSYLVFLVQLTATLFPLVVIILYLTRMTEVLGRGALVLAVFSGWIWILLLAAQLYLWPFLVHQDKGVFTAAKRSVLLLLMRPGASLGLLLAALPVAAINYPFPFIPLALFQVSLTAFLGTVGLLVALEEYPET